MTIKRTITCDICGITEAEAAPNDGWPGWGSIHGIALNGVPNPTLCPDDMARVAEFIDKELRYGVD